MSTLENPALFVKKTLVWMFLLCLVPGHAMAARLPGYVLYSDSDPAASYLGIPPGGRQAVRQAVNAAIRKDPRNAVALSHRAYLFVDSGDLKRARRDFDAALASAEPGSDPARNVLWSRGWANYDLGEVDAALADWEQALALHGGHPYWATYTLALGYWTRGDADAALAWYSAAVEAVPVMGTAAGMEQRIRHWRAPQQLHMRALFAAWKARQPAVAG